MPGLLVYPHGDALIADLDASKARVDQTTHVAIGALGGEVVIALPTTAGSWIFGRVDLGLFLTAAEAFIATHGDPRQPSRSGTGDVATGSANGSDVAASVHPRAGYLARCAISAGSPRVCEKGTRGCTVHHGYV